MSEATTYNTTQQPANATSAATEGQGKERMFTQTEVNHMIQERLARAKVAPAGDKTDYKALYEAEHSAFENFKADLHKQEVKAKTDAALQDLLKGASFNEKYIGSVAKCLAAENDIALSDDGKIKNAGVLLSAAKDSFGGFIVQTRTIAEPVDHPPVNMTYEDETTRLRKLFTPDKAVE